MHRNRLVRVPDGPAAALFGRHRAPALAQGAALFRRQRLEFAEGFADLRALLGSEVMEGARVLAHLAALLRSHFRPTRQTVLDLSLALRWQGGPVQGVFGQAVLPPGLHPVPFALQRREQALLAIGKTGPGKGLLFRTSIRRRRRPLHRHG